MAEEEFDRQAYFGLADRFVAIASKATDDAALSDAAATFPYADTLRAQGQETLVKPQA